MILDYSIAVSTAATYHPVTIADAKKQLEIAEDDRSHDDHIGRLITAAVEKVEHDARRSLAVKTYIEKRECFPNETYLYLHRFPLSSVTSIAYVDTSGSSQTFSSSNYVVDTARHVVWLAYSQYWPSIRYQPEAVTITYVAGDTQPNIPQMARQAILMLVAHWFESREPVLVGTTSAPLQLSYDALIASISRGEYP